MSDKSDSATGTLTDVISFCSVRGHFTWIKGKHNSIPCIVYWENNLFIEIQITVTEAKHLKEKKDSLTWKMKNTICTQESAILTELVHCSFNIQHIVASLFCRGVDETGRKRWVKEMLASAAGVWFSEVWSTLKLNSPQSPYFTNALKPQLDFPLKKTSQNKSGASLGEGMEREKKKKTEDEMGKKEKREDVSLSPSHAYVCVLVCWSRVSPFHPPTNQPPTFLRLALPVKSRAQ